jgi:hypothetical protein
MIRKLMAGVVSAALVAGAVYAAEPLKSGPQVGDKVSAFKPLHATGETAGEKVCLVCKYGEQPVVAVFARCNQCEGTSTLVKKLDAAVKEHSKCELASFVVFLSDDEKIGDKLKEYATTHAVKNVTLASEAPTGPAKYNINKDADVTVVMYVDHTVKASHAFKKGELDAAKADAVVKDLAKILPEKK